MGEGFNYDFYVAVQQVINIVSGLGRIFIKILSVLLLLYSSKHAGIHVWSRVMGFHVVNPGSAQVGLSDLIVLGEWSISSWCLAPLVLLPFPF